MPLPMIGTMRFVVERVRPFSIHGDVYLELLAVAEDSGEGFALRVPGHAVSGEVKAGDRVEATFLMGQVTAAKVVVA